MQKEIENLKNLIIDIACRFVTVPEKLEVETRTVGVIHDLRIVPDDSDIGRIIGVKGSRWKAFNAICQAVSRKNRIRIELLAIREPLGEKRDWYPAFEPQTEWPIEDVRMISQAMAEACFMEEDSIEVEIIDKDETSTIIIHVGTSERYASVCSLERAFNDLLDAIGLTVGRKIRTSIIADVVRQPESADGRSTEAVNR